MNKILKGKVDFGKQLGRTIGFPTANMEVEGEVWESAGVYYGRCTLDGQVYRVIINIGRHPTVPEGAPTVEAHLIGFEGDLYGQEIEVELIRYLRSEVKFASVEDLKAQLEKDRAAAMELPI